MLFCDFIHEFIDVYGCAKWSHNVYRDNKARCKHYILPSLGKYELEKITTYDIERFYGSLITRKSPKNNKNDTCSLAVIREIDKLLKTAFECAIKWGFIDKNPVRGAVRPQERYNTRSIWTAEQFELACSVCVDDILLLAMHLSFACTLRIGEIMALQWDRVDLDSPSPSLLIDRTIQRIGLEELEVLPNRRIYQVIPPKLSYSSSRLVLKEPKTRTSIRRVYIPQTVVNMLKRRKCVVLAMKSKERYCDYGLVLCYSDGTPIEPEHITRRFSKLVSDNNLPKVVFHSLRHTSITYKLILTNGDIKSVQADSGHSHARMITEIYSHVIDEERAKNACLFENKFYAKKRGGKNDNIESSNYLESLLRTEEGRKLLQLLSELIEERRK